MQSSNQQSSMAQFAASWHCNSLSLLPCYLFLPDLDEAGFVHLKQLVLDFTIVVVPANVFNHKLQQTANSEGYDQ